MAVQHPGPRETFTRESIVARLRVTIAEGRPIVAAGSSVGIVAKSAERGGADLIVCYSTGKSRIAGLPTTRMGDSNPSTMAMYDEIANVVDHTPIVGGAEAGDPTYRRLGKLVHDFQATGFDGIINFPSVGPRREFGAVREHIGQGLLVEYELIRLAREAGMFTMGYAYHVDQARGLAEAGVDVQVPHAGWTTGGDQGAVPDQARSLEAAADHVQAIIEASREVNPDIICLAHGGSISSPEDTQYIYDHTDAQGFVGASSVERIPIERGIRTAIEEFKATSLRGARA